jgi:hypothetical protein
MTTIPERLPRLVLLAALACASAASTAHADTPPPAAATPAATAEQLAEQAYQEHASGKEAEAIATYLRAFELSHAGAILFNVATIYDRKLGERGLAEDFYRRYLVAPDAEPDLVQKATERLTALKKQDEAEKSAAIAVAPVPAPPAATGTATAPPPPPAPQPTPLAPTESPASPPSDGHALRTAGIVVGAVGIAGVGASLVLGAMAKSKNDDANAVCNGAACSSDRGVTLANQAGSLATASTATFIAGLALVGGGVAMFVLAPRSPGPVAQWSVSPTVATSGAGLRLAGTF